MTRLLPAQEGHWELMCALSPEGPGVSRLLVVDNRFVYAPIDPVAIRRAFADVVCRHDALRLVFEDTGVEPRLRIEPSVEPPVEYLDLTGRDETSVRDILGEIVYSELHRTFDLTAGPPWHAWYIRLGAERHFINVCFSEIIADGWASKVFMEDLLIAHAVHVGAAPAPPPLPLSFAEMDDIQRARLAPTPTRLAHWRTRLLPLGRPPLFRSRLTDDTSLLVRHRIDVDFQPAILPALRGLAWHARTSLFVVLMAAYHVLLTAASGRERTVVSTAALGRMSSRERRSLLPCTIDPYVATTLPRGVSLRDAVARTHESMSIAMANLVPFTAVARAVNPDFDAQRPWPDFELCDGNFFSAAFEDTELSLSGMRVTMPRMRSKKPADLTPMTLLASAVAQSRRAAWAAYGGPSLEVSHARDGCALIYGDMYDPAEMRAHLDGYLAVVRLMATAPETTVGAVADRYGQTSA